MDKFNIAQGPAHNDPTFVVIDGQRTDSGHLAAGDITLAKQVITCFDQHEEQNERV